MEKRLFLQILKKLSHVIEKKKSDGASLKEKEKVWHLITEKFNTSLIISTRRITPQLKKFWSNLTANQRDIITKERQSVMKTSGEPHRGTGPGLTSSTDLFLTPVSTPPSGIFF